MLLACSHPFRFSFRSGASRGNKCGTDEDPKKSEDGCGGRPLALSAAKVPFAETDVVDQPASLYAATKKSNEMMAHTYKHVYGLSFIGLRFFTVCPPLCVAGEPAQDVETSRTIPPDVGRSRSNIVERRSVSLEGSRRFIGHGRAALVASDSSHVLFFRLRFRRLRRRLRRRADLAQFGRCRRTGQGTSARRHVRLQPEPVDSCWKDMALAMANHLGRVVERDRYRETAAMVTESR